MPDGYPFVGIVRSSEYYLSITTLEQREASTELINAIVHGPFELAQTLLREFDSSLVLEQNPRVIQG